MASKKVSSAGKRKGSVAANAKSMALKAKLAKASTQTAKKK